MNAVKNMGVPESSVLVTTDRHEEKSTDSVIQCICMLEGTVQVNVPEFPRPEMTTPRTTQSADKKLDDRLVMNHSEATKDLLVLAAATRNIHMDPDKRALSAQLYFLLIMVCQKGAQKLLEHAGDSEGGVAWRRLLDEYEPRTAGRQCALLQELLHHGFPVTREQRWARPRCCFASTARCQERTSAKG